MSDLPSKCILTFVFFILACGTVYADENVSFDKYNFVAEQADQSQMTNTQTTSQELMPSQGQNSPVEIPQSTSVGASYLPWQLHTNFRSGVAFDNNFFRTRHDPKGEIIFQNGPTFLFSNKNSPFCFNVDYEPTFETYYRYHGYDSLDQNLKGSYYRQLGRFYDRGVELLGYSSQGRTPEESVGTKIFSNDYFNEFGYKIDKNFSAALIYKNDIMDYLAQSINSYTENTVGPRIYYHLRPKMDLYIQSLYSAYNYNHDASRNSNDVATTVGIRGALDNKTSFKIEGGVQTGSQNSTQDGFVAEAIVEHQFTPKTQVTLIAEKGTQQSTFIDGSYGYWLLSSEIVYKYSPKTTISFVASWQNDSYSTATTEIDPATLMSVSQKRQDYIDTECLSLTYALNKKLSLKGTISREEELSNFKVFQYEDYLFELSLNYDF